MKTDSIRPTSLVGIKKLAKQIKKSAGIPHAAALDAAAEVANFANYKNAQRRLIRNPQTIYISVYWLSADGFQGRETLPIGISLPVLELANRSQFRMTRGLSDMRLVATDHFVSDSLYPTQDAARRQACMAARTLQFMDATGLLPSREERRRRAKQDRDVRLPGMDHPSDWYDPLGAQYILVDEPYLGPEDQVDERQAWAHEHGWQLEYAPWSGMYYPGMASMYLACRTGGGPGLGRILEALRRAPSPVTEGDWAGHSAHNHQTFVSPAAKTPQDIRRAKSIGTIRRRRSAHTAPYQLLLGGRSRRPLPRMPVEVHVRVSRLLHSVRSDEDWEVYQRVNSVRSTLDDWLQMEYGRRELSDELFHTMYYGDGLGHGDPEAIAASTVRGRITNLQAVRNALTHSYRDCAPLRRILHKIDVALSRMRQRTH